LTQEDEMSPLKSFFSFCSRLMGSGEPERAQDPQERPAMFSGEWSSEADVLADMKTTASALRGRSIVFAHLSLDEPLDEREAWVVLAKGEALWLAHQVWGPFAGQGDVLERVAHFAPKKITAVRLAVFCAKEPWAPVLQAAVEARLLRAEIAPFAPVSADSVDQKRSKSTPKRI
jgi:hypothetical protein